MMSLFDDVIVAGDGMQDGGSQEQLVWNLRNWPLELIEWDTRNSHRLDIRLNPECER
jgi:hypothetical protein